MKHKKTSNSKAILRKNKKNGAAGIRLPDFRLYSLTSDYTIFLYKNRNMDQWNRIQSPEINPNTNKHKPMVT